uniref:Uncharacterized protein n=1 Tax=Utricularia reniformis TaxID=192314 RepID=A0A1Y0B285_9LAMI|nr:hypothetical protein AEK19_MT1358 [Utricularia reniformis]ART31556.1 hypothetical protein AEK19_MT1358 [Utricularia reniformis]
MESRETLVLLLPLNCLNGTHMIVGRARFFFVGIC